MAVSGIAQRLPGWWYQRHLKPALWPLLPLACAFALLVGLRRALYRCGALRSHRLSVPVIVVGNLTVGGSGKTPLVLWLVHHLRASGWRPGIISRGYGGSARQVQAVTPDSACSLVGDEPVLLARRSAAPVFVGRDRVATGQALLAAHPECDLIVCDDGLQHYRLQRAVELVVFDGRAAGNGWLLPAGPLREPLRRLSRASAVVWNGPRDPGLAGAAGRLPQFDMQLVGQRFVAASGGSASCGAAALLRRKLHALAGIGDPSRFFRQLRALGLEFEEHPFPDHHSYRAEDLAFAGDGALLMTEKDAVKCAALLTGEAWVLPVDAVVSPPPGQAGLLETLLEKLHGRTPA